jgi:hypothetical protein
MSQRLEPSNFVDADPVHIYLDLDIVNNDFTGLSQPRQVVFNEIRNNPYVLNPNKYFFSVVRFELQTPTLPVFIPIIAPEPNPNYPATQPNPYTDNLNYTPYQIAIRINSINYIQRVDFVPQNFVISNPQPPTQIGQPTHPYYYCYTYQQFLNSVNAAIAAAWNLVPTTGNLRYGPAPSFWYDESSSRIKLNAVAQKPGTPSTAPPIAVWNSGQQAEPLVPATTATLWMNEPLYNLLSGFDFVNYGRPSNGDQQPFQYRMKIYQQFENTKANPLATNNASLYLIMTSEQIDIAVWNPIKALVFTSGLIPLLPTLTSQPKSLESSGAFSSYGNNSNLSTQMTDFEVPFSATNTYKQSVNYQPSGEYRLIDIQSDLPVNSIQVSVFWKNLDGILTPFYLDGGQSGNIKIMFRRKDFNNIEY